MDTAEDGDLGHDNTDLTALDTNAPASMAVMDVDDVDGDGSKEGEDQDEEALLHEPAVPQTPMALMEVDDVNGVDYKEGEEDQEEATLDAPTIQDHDKVLQQTDDVDLTNSPKSRRSASMQEQLHPIEVVLEPPTDPASYERIDLPSSWYVFKVLEQIDLGDEDDYGQDSWYSVEFDDGRVDQLSYDDLRSLGNGRAALERFKGSQDVDDEEVTAATHGTKRRRVLDSSDLDGMDEDEQPRMALRRSTRQKTTSRQPSVDYAPTFDIGEDISNIDNLLDGEDDEDDEDFQKTPQEPANRRSTRPRNSIGKNYVATYHSSEDELANDSDDAFKPVTSDLPNVKSNPKKKKGRGRPKMNTRRGGRDSSIEFEPVRKSGRATKDTTYIVPDVDDDYDFAEEKVTSAPKHVNVREIFPPAPEEFAQLHATTCQTCGLDARSAKGPLIGCQGCSSAYHKSTPKVEERLRLENGGEDPITKVDPVLVNNADTLLFRCTACRRGYHYDHLPPTTRESEIPDDLRAARVEEYSMLDWRCKDCADAEHKMQTLVAWRPIDQDSYAPGTTLPNICEDDKEYLVKWDKVSHFHDTWMPGAWIFGVSPGQMRVAFQRKEENMLPKMTFEAAVDEEWLLPDVILNLKYSRNPSSSSKAKDLARLSDVREIFVKFQGLPYTEVVWDQPPSKDSGAPYAAFEAAYNDYIEGIYFPHVSDQKMAERVKQFRGLNFERECELHEQPKSLKQGNLMAYQLEGVNWMLWNFHQSLNVILADEMGLGKTIQVVALITALVHDKPNCWPFLIVVPNATCPNWRRELKNWAPELRVCTYHGGRAAQDLAYRHEIFPEGVKGGIKAHVVIMSYEAAVDAKSSFRSVKWQGLIVDEGQRLKNDKSLLYNALRDMKIPFRLLLTGTPLQNNKRELFNLLQFIDPSLNAEELDEKYADLTKDTIKELHDLIRPYFLRRTKATALKFLPPMAQIILPVTMTFLQEKLSKSIISKNSHLIRAIIQNGRTKAGERKSLNNILMELRRVLCHPFLFSDSVEDRTITDPVMVQHNLVEASGKLKLLNTLLPKLKERGHRVLIFSQFLLSLTILEDFMTAIGLAHARIDGSLSALEKQKRIDAFNDPNSELFAMLLSTRAGGVGINLATADTVIIYDPDFNPHQDIQALSRAHRIGQKNKVLCFQMTTKDTVEEKIMQIGRKKMALDHALIESMDIGEDAGNDLESILKHGAEALFSDDARDHIVYDEASVEKLLDRSQMETTISDDDKSAETQFSFARVWENDQGALVTNSDESAQDRNAPSDQNVWENILKQRQEEHEREVAAQQREYGRGARRRNQDVRYDAVGGPIEGVNDGFLTHRQLQVTGDLSANSSDDDDFEGGKDSAESDGDEDIDSDSGIHRARKGRKRPAPKSQKSQTPPNTSRTPSMAPAKKKAKAVNTQSSSGKNNRATPRKPAARAPARTSAAPSGASKRPTTAKTKRPPQKAPSRTVQAETEIANDSHDTTTTSSTSTNASSAVTANDESSKAQQPAHGGASTHVIDTKADGDKATAAVASNGSGTSS
ncbi:Tripeptidyl-peptidase sed2 [Pestalotiopsis sp. IQ-011]